MLVDDASVGRLPQKESIRVSAGRLPSDNCFSPTMGSVVRVSQLVSSPASKRISKLLSLVLRHEPERMQLVLDASGWVDVDALLAAFAENGSPITRAELELLVRSSDKQRFALSEGGRRIRANQGHSVEVDLGYAPGAPPAILFHGTVAKFLDSIRASGLDRGERHHVHLSATKETAQTVAQRRGQPIILEVRATAMAVEGHLFFMSTNGVWLTGHVPAGFIVFPANAPPAQCTK